MVFQHSVKCKLQTALKNPALTASQPALHHLLFCVNKVLWSPYQAIWQRWRHCNAIQMCAERDV